MAYRLWNFLNKLGIKYQSREIVSLQSMTCANHLSNPIHDQSLLSKALHDQSMTSANHQSNPWQVPITSPIHDKCQSPIQSMTSANHQSNPWQVPISNPIHDKCQSPIQSMTSANLQSNPWHVPISNPIHDKCQSPIQSMTCANHQSNPWHVPITNPIHANRCLQKSSPCFWRRSITWQSLLAETRPSRASWATSAVTRWVCLHVCVYALCMCVYFSHYPKGATCIFSLWKVTDLLGNRKTVFLSNIFYIYMVNY